MPTDFEAERKKLLDRAEELDREAQLQLMRSNPLDPQDVAKRLMEVDDPAWRTEVIKSLTSKATITAEFVESAMEIERRLLHTLEPSGMQTGALTLALSFFIADIAACATSPKVIEVLGKNVAGAVEAMAFAAVVKHALAEKANKNKH